MTTREYEIEDSETIVVVDDEAAFSALPAYEEGRQDHRGEVGILSTTEGNFCRPGPIPNWRTHRPCPTSPRRKRGSVQSRDGPLEKGKYMSKWVKRALTPIQKGSKMLEYLVILLINVSEVHDVIGLAYLRGNHLCIDRHQGALG
jgi:hypothetical protein